MIKLNINQLNNLGMGEFDPTELSYVQSIFDQIDFKSDMFVSEYGSINSLMNDHRKLEDASERSFLNDLARKLSQIVAQMKIIEKNHTSKRLPLYQRVFRSMLGPVELEDMINARVASMNFGELIESARTDAKQVKSRISLMDAMLNAHHEEVEHIRHLIVAGRLYLELNPNEGIPDDTELTFTNVRERFARRLANLSALLASHEMSFVQMKLAKAQSIDLCDRFTEVSEVLVPIWKHYQSTLKGADQSDPETLASANKVHEALVQSLTKSISNLTETRH